MTGYRLQQVNASLQEAIARLLLTEMTDERLRRITVTHVEVSRDFGYARIYVTALGNPKQRQDSFKALQNAGGHIRRTLAREIRMRAVPQLRFFYDESLDQAERIAQLLREAPPPAGDSSTEQKE